MKGVALKLPAHGACAGGMTLRHREPVDVTVIVLGAIQRHIDRVAGGL